MSKRIRALAELVPSGSVLADIGTDHGLLPILAIELGIVSKAYACDVAEGPLSQAAANIAQKGLQDSITTILGNGFENVPEDCTSAVLAGMGYYTAAGILEDAIDRLGQFKAVIVQINADVPMLRKWISDHHFTIQKERTIEDRKKYYTAIVFNTDQHEAYTELQQYAGVEEVQEDKATWIEYLNWKRCGIMRIIELGADPTEHEAELNALNAILNRSEL